MMLMPRRQSAEESRGMKFRFILPNPSVCHVLYSYITIGFFNCIFHFALALHLHWITVSGAIRALPPAAEAALHITGDVQHVTTEVAAENDPICALLHYRAIGKISL